ncbi:MAG: YicC/YloC family endoribonuclease, partial [Ignavibacteria bacterium]
MIISMTGYGRSKMVIKKMDINVELRSVNSKYLEVSSRLPIIFSDKENEIKELIKNKISRGKINVLVSVERNSLNNINLHLSSENVKSYYNLLNDIKRIVKSKEEIKIEHLLKFSEIFKVEENEEVEKHWVDVVKILDLAIKDLCSMKKKEGKILEKDIIN